MSLGGGETTILKQHGTCRSHRVFVLNMLLPRPVLQLQNIHLLKFRSILKFTSITPLATRRVTIFSKWELGCAEALGVRGDLSAASLAPL